MCVRENTEESEAEVYDLKIIIWIYRAYADIARSTMLVTFAFIFIHTQSRCEADNN